MKVGVVIVYSSIDAFLWEELASRVKAFADEIIAVRRTHLFAGQPEPEVDLGVSTVLMDKAEKPGWEAVQEMRRAGAESLPPVDRILFLDSDELPDPELLQVFLHTPDPIYFSADVYWRKPWIRQVQNNEVAGLLCRPEDLVWDRKGEREVMTKRPIIRPRIKNPFMYHFAWCKPIESMILKVSNWGHSGERDDWVEKVKKEWASPLPGNCFIHKGRPLEECEPRIQL